MYLKLSTPARTAIARWMMDGNCSVTNSLIARAGELLMRPTGIGYSYLCFDAFGAAQGMPSELVVVGPKFLAEKAKENEGVMQLWAPAFANAAFTSLVIHPPFLVTIGLNRAAAKPEAFAAMEKAVADGLENDINQAYADVIGMTEALITRCMQFLLLEDEQAVVSYLNDPASLVDLVLSLPADA